MPRQGYTQTSAHRALRKLSYDNAAVGQFFNYVIALGSDDRRNLIAAQHADAEAVLAELSLRRLQRLLARELPTIQAILKSRREMLSNQQIPTGPSTPPVGQTRHGPVPAPTTHSHLHSAPDDAQDADDGIHAHQHFHPAGENNHTDHHEDDADVPGRPVLVPKQPQPQDGWYGQMLSRPSIAKRAAYDRARRQA